MFAERDATLGVTPRWAKMTSDLAPAAEVRHPPLKIMAVTDEELAIEGAVDEATEEGAAALRRFPLKVQERALVRLLSRVQRKRMQQAPPQPEQAPKPAAQPAAEPPKRTLASRGVPKKGAASPALKDDGGEATVERRSKRRQIWEILVAHPERSIGNIAIDVYGEDTEQTRSNVRSQLDQMKRRGMARAAAPGKWRAIQPAEAPSE